MKFLRIHLMQRVFLCGLVLCMGLAQSVTVAHRTLHHDVRMLAHTHEEHHAHSHEAACDHGWLIELFASHEEGDENCRVMDGASGFDVLFTALISIGYAQNAIIYIATWQTVRAAWAALLFEARGPPLFSL